MSMREWTRQHPWGFGLGLALVAATALSIAMAIQLRAMKRDAASQRQRLTDMERLADEYDALKTAAPKQRVAASAAALSLSLVDRIAQEKGVKTTGTVIVPPAKVGDRFMEHAISLAVVGVTRTALNEFLRAVEESDAAIRTKELNIRRNARDTSLVDASVKFSILYEAPATASK